MKVKELRDTLSTFDGEMLVYVYWEEGADHQYFGIDDVATQTGTPVRLDNEKVTFEFGKDGPATWVCISISPE